MNHSKVQHVAFPGRSRCNANACAKVACKAYQMLCGQEDATIKLLQSPAHGEGMALG